MSLHCSAKTRQGAPCRAFATRAGPYCFWHDPANEKKRIWASRKGGKATLEDMYFNQERREMWASIAHLQEVIAAARKRV